MTEDLGLTASESMAYTAGGWRLFVTDQDDNGELSGHGVSSVATSITLTRDEMLALRGVITAALRWLDG